MNTAKALIIVDVQNDFCEGGSLAVAGGSAVAQAITGYVASHRDEYAHVVATRDYHIEPGEHFSDRPDFDVSWPPHCVVGTAGLEFHPSFDVGAAEAIFSKGEYAPAYSGFEGTADEDGAALAEWLRERRIQAVDVVGIATDFCVRATALDAKQGGFATRVLLDLTAGVARGSTDRALGEMRETGVELAGTPVVHA